MSATALQGVVPIDDEGEFMQALKQELEEGPDRELVLFVHGYNVSFNDAVTSAAQLTYDTSPLNAPLPRVAMAFDWACCKQWDLPTRFRGLL
jgi:esterase/lipase superfamily enzyme